MSVETQWLGSPNKETGRRGYRPEAIVVHIMDGTLTGTDRWFADTVSRVSAHYGIGAGGEIHQYVAEGDTAWHAGRREAATWGSIKPNVNANFYTIGIEHEGKADTPWSDAMFTASARLAAEICNRWSIPADRNHLVGHREIYARKTCPGTWLDLDQWVLRAREATLAPSLYNFVEHRGTTAARVDLNLRRAAPTTSAPVERTAAKGEVLPYIGWTSNGLTVNGNAHWYKADGELYFWAGATTQTVPNRI